MMNSFLGIGHIGQSAELTTTRTGNPMARFSIAIDRRARKDEPKEADWIRCFLFGDRANLLAPYLAKGTLVGVSGRLESYRSPDDERSMLGVDVDEVNFLKWPQEEAAPATARVASGKGQPWKAA